MKIGIIGLGLIGGSIALSASNAGHNVFGFDVEKSSMERALELGAIEAKSTIKNMRDECDLVVVCVPARKAFEVIKEALIGNAVVTDVSSTKANICQLVNELDKKYSERFIGGHPMAGSEQSGIDSARGDLFENKMWILVPPASSSLTNIKTVEEFVSSLSAEHCVLDPDQHDQLVAYISHLPQLASSALMDIAADKSVDNEILLRLAGGGFRDMTRIAASNIAMWLDIVQENKSKLLKAIDDYLLTLNSLRYDVENDNIDKIKELFIRASTARSSLPEAARRLENLSEILVPVPDVPGVLTTITSMASDINIYDIKIVHALEQDRGVLSLVVDPKVATDFAAKLTEAGFETKIVDLRNE